MTLAREETLLRIVPASDDARGLVIAPAPFWDGYRVTVTDTPQSLFDLLTALMEPAEEVPTFPGGIAFTNYDESLVAHLASAAWKIVKVGRRYTLIPGMSQNFSLPFGDTAGIFLVCDSGTVQLGIAAVG
jgi:hypothetical protein